MSRMDRVLWSVTKGIFLLVVAFLIAAAKSIVKPAVSLTGGILRALAGKSRKRCRKRSERRTGIEVMTQQPHAAVFRISGPIRQCKSLADAKKNSLPAVSMKWQLPIFALRLSSALMCLTSVFEMGTGISTSLSSPQQYLFY